MTTFIEGMPEKTRRAMFEIDNAERERGRRRPRKPRRGGNDRKKVPTETMH